MKQKKIISLILVVVWMMVIFIMSSFVSTQSDNQSNFIVDIIASILNVENIDILSYIVRKAAHFTEYLILGVLVYNFVSCYNKKYYLAIIICVLYAVSDEIHQIFVPGRSCQIFDMLIDCFGSLTSIVILNMFMKFKKNKKI